jgi:hypothetical protein
MGDLKIPATGLLSDGGGTGFDDIGALVVR